MSVDWATVHWHCYVSARGVRAVTHRLKPGQMRKGETYLTSCHGVSRKTALARAKAMVIGLGEAG